MVHDLREPLTVIRGYLSLIAEEAFGPVAPQIKDVVLPTLMAELERADRLVDRLNERDPAS